MIKKKKKKACSEIWDLAHKLTDKPGKLNPENLWHFKIYCENALVDTQKLQTQVHGV